MEVFIDVSVEDNFRNKKIKVMKLIYTFVAVDQLGNPIHVPELVPRQTKKKIVMQVHYVVDNFH